MFTLIHSRTQTVPTRARTHNYVYIVRLDIFNLIGDSGVVMKLNLDMTTGIGVSSATDSSKLCRTIDRHIFICMKAKRFPVTKEQKELC